jgi:hypothetical protein
LKVKDAEAEEYRQRVKDTVTAALRKLLTLLEVGEQGRSYH